MPRALTRAGSILLVLAVAAPALAQTPEEASRVAFEAGEAADAAGRKDEACVHFRASVEKARLPGPLSRSGRCDAAEGKLREAIKKYDELLSKLPAENPRRAEYEAERARFRAQLGRITLKLRAGAATAATATVDGEPAPAWGVPLEVDPGAHTVKSGGATKLVTVASGSEEIVVLPLETSETTASGASPWAIGAGVSFGVGGAAAVVAAVTGGLIIAKDGDAEVACGLDASSAACRELTDEGKALLAPNLAIWIVAGAGIAAGVVFVIVDHTSSPVGAPGPQVSLTARPTGGALTVTF